MKTLAVIALMCIFTPVHAEVTYNGIYTSVNTVRVAHGLPVLRHSEALDRVANDRLHDMITNNYFAHISPTGLDEWTWYKKEGYNFKESGENLAEYYDTSEQTITAWMNSPTHRQNILSPKYTETGIATNGVITVQEFGKTRAEYLSALGYTSLTTK